MPWGRRRDSGGRGSVQGATQPIGGPGDRLSRQYSPDAGPGHTRAEWGPPRGMVHTATPRNSPTYHLVHGDVLAVVIQPDGHLGREAELPGGGGRAGLVPAPAPCPPPPGRRPPAPPTLPEVDGLLLG